MASKRVVTRALQPANYRPTAAERRAARVAALSTKQAELKQEAADRRAARAAKAAAAAQLPEPPTTDE